MAKLTILAATLLALLALSHVTTAYRATITTTVVDEDEENDYRRSSQQRCRQQLRQQQDLRHCQMYLLSQRVRNPMHLGDCCRELQSMETGCRCQNLREMMRQRQRGQIRGQEMQEAQNLPARCNLSPQRCQM